MALTTVKLYKYTGDPKTANKVLGTALGTTQSLQPLQPLSNLDVSILINYDESYMNANYIECDTVDNTHKKYYKIKDRKRMPANALEITARIDAVKTYFDQIKSCPAIAARTATKGKYTLYVPDGKIKTNAYTFQETRADTVSGNMFGYNAHFVLITVG